MIKVVKIGGNVIDNPTALKAFLEDFIRMPQPKVLVHGGGKEATRISSALGIETKMIEGRRVTDAETLDVVTMVYAGLINKRIVAALQQLGENAIGLSGADGALMPASRRPASPIDYGFVGDLDSDDISLDTINTLLDGGMTPVVCAIALNKEPQTGALLNCNADSVAQAIAIACSRIAPTTLYYCFEKPGVLLDIDDPDSVIPEIDRSTFETLKADKKVHSGMLPKISNALTAVEAGLDSVIIKSSEALLQGGGTIIK